MQSFPDNAMFTLKLPQYAMDLCQAKPVNYVNFGKELIKLPC